MRTLVERSQGRDLVLVDGVKVIEEDGWALVLPDPEEPVTHVWAEAPSAAQAEARAQRVRHPARAAAALTPGTCDGPATAVAGRRSGGQVGSAPMNVPEDLRYSTDHEWARTDGDRFRVGITDYAQDALGDVVFVDLPGHGARRSRPAGCSARSSRPSRSRRSTPRWPARWWPSTPPWPTRPRRLNADPYGDGWICEIAPADPAALDALLDADGYRQLTEG